MHLYIFSGNYENLFDTKVYGDTGTILYSLVMIRTYLMLKSMEIQVCTYIYT